MIKRTTTSKGKGTIPGNTSWFWIDSNDLYYTALQYTWDFSDLKSKVLVSDKKKGVTYYGAQVMFKYKNGTTVTYELVKNSDVTTTRQLNSYRKT